MKIDIMTLFPDAIDAMMGQSIMGQDGVQQPLRMAMSNSTWRLPSWGRYRTPL